MIQDDATRAKRIFDQLCAEGVVAGAAANEAIDLAQSELGVVFPDEYRAVLNQYGAVLIKGFEIYGLPDPAMNDPPLWVDVCAVTTKLRQWGQAGTEDSSFLPFSGDGTGVYFFLNTAAAPNSEIWAIGPGVERKVGTSIFEFVLDYVEGRISL